MSQVWMRSEFGNTRRTIWVRQSYSTRRNISTSSYLLALLNTIHPAHEMHLVGWYGWICFGNGINQKRNWPIGRRTFWTFVCKVQVHPINKLETRYQDHATKNLRAFQIFLIDVASRGLFVHWWSCGGLFVKVLTSGLRLIMYMCIYLIVMCMYMNTFMTRIHIYICEYTYTSDSYKYAHEYICKWNTYIHIWINIYIDTYEYIYKPNTYIHIWIYTYYRYICLYIYTCIPGLDEARYPIWDYRGIKNCGHVRDIVDF